MKINRKYTAVNAGQNQRTKNPLKAMKKITTLLHLFLIVSPLLTTLSGVAQKTANISTTGGILVNTNSGHMRYRHEGIFLPSEYLPIATSFAYNSGRRSENYGYGRGWTFSYGMYYEKDSVGNMIVRYMDGHKELFVLNASDSSFSAPKDVYDVLEEYASGLFKITTKQGMEYYFSDPAHQKLTRMVDSRSNEITLQYRYSLLTQIVDPYGRSLQLTWSNGLLVSMTDDNASPTRTYAYKYDDEDQLIAVTNPLGNQKSFRYGNNHEITAIIDENGNEFGITYSSGYEVNKVISCFTVHHFSYNKEKNKTYVVEQAASGNQITTYHHDDEGRITHKSGNCCGYDVSYEYDARDNVIHLTDANQNITTFTYDSKGNVLTITDPLSNVLLFSYEPNFNNIATQTDRNGNIIRYTYDNKGNLTQVNHPLSLSEIFTYDGKGNVLTYTDKNNNTSTYTYDSYGNPLSETNAEGETRNYEYDARGNLIKYTDASGHETAYTYDAMNNLLTYTDPLGNTTTYTYDGLNNLLTETDANAHTTTYMYDPLNRLIEIEDPLGGRTNYTYDQKGNRLSETNPNGYTTTYTYDERNFLQSETDPLGNKSSYSYDGNGKVLSFTDRSSITLYDYDALGQLLTLTDPNGNTILRSYDPEGNFISITDANGNITSYTYDALNRLIKATDPLNGTVTATYDSNENLLSVVDKNGVTVASFTYDKADRKVSETDALGNTTSYTYDAEGRIIQITDAEDHSTIYTYDERGLKLTETFADGTSKTYTYDGVGNTLTRTDNRGYITSYTYDALNRLVKEDFSNGSANVFTYDAQGNLLTASNQHSLITFTYDALDRVTSETLNGKTTHTLYDDANYSRRLTYPGGRTIEGKMDLMDRLIRINENGREDFVFQYDPASRPVSRNYPNEKVVSYSFDEKDLMKEVAHDPAIVRFRYQHDAVGNPLSEEKVHRPTHSQNYGYDENHRVTSYREGSDEIANQTQYTYNGVGGRTTAEVNGATISYTSNEMHEYTTIESGGTINLGYDENGNLIDDGINTYTYDYENRLIAVNDGSTATYLYDALGRRIQKTVGTEVTQYFYDDLQVIEERNGSNAVLATYVYGIWIDDILSMQRNGINYYYHANVQGSIAAITDDNGQVVERYEYSPYGETMIYTNDYTLLTSSMIRNPYLYVGRRLDEETGWYYYRARHYAPSQGRFIQRDPLGYVDGYNLYEYVKGRPLVLLDPEGEYAAALTCPPVLIAATIVIGGWIVWKTAENYIIYKANDTYTETYLEKRKTCDGCKDAGTRTKTDTKTRTKKEKKERSEHPIGKRDRSNTKKKAYEKAKRAGNGNEPVNHPNDPNGPHYHPGDGKGKPLNHDHYFYPKHRR